MTRLEVTQFYAKLRYHPQSKEDRQIYLGVINKALTQDNLA